MKRIGSDGTSFRERDEESYIQSSVCLLLYRSSSIQETNLHFLQKLDDGIDQHHQTQSSQIAHRDQALTSGERDHHSTGTRAQLAAMQALITFHDAASRENDRGQPLMEW